MMAHSSDHSGALLGEPRRVRRRLIGRRRTILPAVLLLVCLGSWGSTARAANYYFSNCAQGGAGTLANPYCLDPGGSGLKVSFKYLMDGASPDVGPGDTINLCAGPCDGTGTGTYNLGVYGTTTNGDTYVFSPVVSGTQASPITIQAYPGETVILSGDTNGNNIPEVTEPDVLVTNVTTAGANKAWYVWRNLIFERVRSMVFYLNANPANWTIDNIEVRYFSTEMWSGPRDLNETGCTNEMGGFVFKVADLAAPLTIKNSRFHDICGMVHRHTVNDAPGASMLIENNEYYNLGSVNNDFIGRNVTYRGNNIHDVIDGIAIEENMKNVVIEDNAISCPGVYKVTPDGRCANAIRVDDGNNGTGGTTKNITIRRNKIFGAVNGSYGGTAAGYFLCGLVFEATNSTESINTLIENNMIWHIWSWSSEPTCATGIGVNTNRSEVTIQNNTVYDSTYGIAVDAKTPGVAYTIRNNLVVRANKNGTNNVELWVGSNATGSTIRYNNLHHDGQGDPVMRVGTTNYNCSQIAGFQTGNKCAPTTFVKVTGAPKDWDLHLSQSDTANRDVSGAVGPADDIDKGARTGAIDLGADEFASASGGTLTAALSLEITAGQSPPSSNGTYLLKAGTYTVRLTTSAPVVVTPTPLTFTDVGGRQVQITLSGSIPGTLVSGSLTIDANVAEGSGVFSLASAALDDGQGNTGNQITAGGTALVDRTPPSRPTSVQTQQ